MKRLVLSLATLAGLVISANAQKYSIGDCYPKDGSPVEGIVFEVSEDGQHGKVFSLAEGFGLKWRTIGDADYTDDRDNGMNNFEIITAMEPEYDGYPAFAWCASLGDGWYIPAINELIKIRDSWGKSQKERKALNTKIKEVGGTPLSDAVYVKAKDAKVSAIYYSSTENGLKRQKIYCLSFNSASTEADGLKKMSDSVENLLFRAVKAF